MPTKEREEDLMRAAHALNESPFYKFVSMKIVNIGEGSSEVHLQLTPDHKNIWQTIHGGVTATLLDSTCGSCLYSSLETNEGAMTVDLRVNFLAGVREGLLTGKGRFIYRTRSLAWSQADAFDQQGNLVARAECIHKIVRRDWGK